MIFLLSSSKAMDKSNFLWYNKGRIKKERYNEQYFQGSDPFKAG